MTKMIVLVGVLWCGLSVAAREVSSASAFTEWAIEHHHWGLLQSNVKIGICGLFEVYEANLSSAKLGVKLD